VNMDAEQIIVKKRDGNELSDQELRFMVTGYVSGRIPDYQMAAFLMAIYFQGMSFEETYLLTREMIESGKRVDFSHLDKFPVDKHSTGGVGDKISIILAPLVAAAGVAVPMMSGRALGHSGGTLDKLEAIPGFRTRLTLSEFVAQVEKIGVAMIGQTDEMVPADRKIYALRDRTGTVPSIPLVVASISSKKIAEGAKALVLDVKTGSGAFFTAIEQATRLAETIIAITKRFDVETTALMTSMDEPLGYAIGNWLETREAIRVLQGEQVSDLVELTLALGSEMLCHAKAAGSIALARDKLQQLLVSGRAYEKFLSLVQTQGGDISVVENTNSYPGSRYHQVVASETTGYIRRIDALKMGLLAMEVGAGRKKITDPVDYGAGIMLRKKVGDPIAKREPLVEIFSSQPLDAGYIKQRIAQAEPRPDLILKYIDEKGPRQWQLHAG